MNQGIIEKVLSIKEDWNIDKNSILNDIKLEKYESVADFFYQESKVVKAYHNDPHIKKVVAERVNKESLSATDIVRANYGLGKFSTVSNFRKLGDLGDLLLMDKVQQDVASGMEMSSNYASINDLVATEVYQTDSDVPVWDVEWSNSKEPDIVRSAPEGQSNTSTIVRKRSDLTIAEYSHVIKGPLKEIEKMPMAVLSLRLKEVGRKFNNALIDAAMTALIDVNSDLGAIIDPATPKLAIEDMIKIESELGEFDSGKVWLMTKLAWQQYRALPQSTQYTFFVDEMKTQEKPNLFGAYPKIVKSFPGVGKDAVSLLSKDTGLLLHTETRGNLVGSTINIEDNAVLKVLITLNAAFQKFYPDSFKYHTLT